MCEAELERTRAELEGAWVAERMEGPPTEPGWYWVNTHGHEWTPCEVAEIDPQMPGPRMFEVWTGSSWAGLWHRQFGHAKWARMTQPPEEE